jgi:hypothetical protein
MDSGCPRSPDRLGGMKVGIGEGNRAVREGGNIGSGGAPERGSGVFIVGWTGAGRLANMVGSNHLIIMQPNCLAIAGKQTFTRRDFMLALGAVALTATTAQAADAVTRASELKVSGTGFTLDGKPFAYTGVSFFNAIYNPTFNLDSATRRKWLRKFLEYNINVHRVWCQWDNKRGFVDGGPEATMYQPDGSLRMNHLKTLKGILDDARAEGVVIELCLFSHESFREGIKLEPEAAVRAVKALAKELQPWRNLYFQIWNEHHDEMVLPLVKAIREVDAKRLITSSPGFAGVLGPKELNEELDFLTPHTSRQGRGKPWELAPKEIATLLKEYNKPVVDDEPARNGTSNFGGPKEPTLPTDHILQIWEVRKVGGHPTYHHDMFQTGYGTPACPPNGIPDPEFSPYHREVFEFLKQGDRYRPGGKGSKEGK